VAVATGAWQTLTLAMTAGVPLQVDGQETATSTGAIPPLLVCLVGSNETAPDATETPRGGAVAVQDA